MSQSQSAASAGWTQDVRDLTRFREFLAQEPVLNTVLLQLVDAALAPEGRPADRLFVATVETGGRIVAAAGRTDFPKMGLAAGSGEVDMRVLARAVFAAMPDLPCVIGPSSLSAVFAEEWARLSGRRPRPGMAQRMYVARTVRAPLVPGAMRPAARDDLELLMEWSSQFDAEALPSGEAQPRDRIERALLERMGAGTMFIWEDGAPVSMAGVRVTAHGVARLGPVYTPPGRRRRGYAGALTAAVTRLMQDGGNTCCLYTDLGNPTSNHVYQDVGYVALADFSEAWFD